MPQAVVGLEARSGAVRGRAALAVWLAAVSLVALVPPSVSMAAEDAELLASDAEAADANRQRLQAVRSKTHTSVSQEPGYLGD